MSKIIALFLVVLCLALLAQAQEAEKLVEAVAECNSASAITASVAVILAFVAALL